MPIYEYVCETCRREFSLLRPMSQADSPAPCESCGGRRIRRKLSLVYAHSEGRNLAGTDGGSACSGCPGGSCSTCGRG